jgi:hypothetical protein
MSNVFGRILRVAVLGASVAVLMAAVGGDGSARASGEGAREAACQRVGVFDTRAVALAYGRSEPFLQWVRELHAEADRAKAEGDEARLKELEREGAGQQERLHRQVFGDAPIDDILERMEGDLAGVAEAAGVDLIVGDVLYRSDSAEVVDITLEMAATFHPDEKTLEILAQLRRTPPVETD